MREECERRGLDVVDALKDPLLAFAVTRYRCKLCGLHSIYAGSLCEPESVE